MSKKSTYGLKPEQIRRLFSICGDGPESMAAISEDKATGLLLRDRLRSVLPKDSSLLDSLLITMGPPARDMQRLIGKSLGEVLLDPESDMDLLQAIKGYGKRLACAVASDAETAVAITIYYAAIASCLVHHDKKITQHPHDILAQSLAELAKKKWITPELKKMFLDAQRLCGQKGTD